jgi:hypothetical protein
VTVVCHNTFVSYRRAPYPLTNSFVLSRPTIIIYTARNIFMAQVLYSVLFVAKVTKLFYNVLIQKESKFLVAQLEPCLSLYFSGKFRGKALAFSE